MHESEASFQAVVDPYARADFFIAFGEEGVELEEGFVTFTVAAGRPADQGRQDARGVRQGQHACTTTCCRGPIGRWSRNNLVGGEDGIDDAGISVARLIPNPWIFLEATGQVVPRRFAATLFKSSQARRPELRRPPARLSRHHRVQQPRPRLLVLARAQRRRRSATTATSGAFDDRAVRHRRDVPLEAAAALDLPLVRRPLGVDLEPPRSAERPAAGDRLLRVGRLPARPALVRRRSATIGRTARTDASLLDTGGVVHR